MKKKNPIVFLPSGGKFQVCAQQSSQYLSWEKGEGNELLYCSIRREMPFVCSEPMRLAEKNCDQGPRSMGPTPASAGDMI